MFQRVPEIFHKLVQQGLGLTNLEIRQEKESLTSPIEKQVPYWCYVQAHVLMTVEIKVNFETPDKTLQFLLNLNIMPTVLSTQSFFLVY